MESDDSTTDNRVEFLLLLCDSLEDNLIGLLLRMNGSLLVKSSATLRRVLSPRFVYSRHYSVLRKITMNPREDRNKRGGSVSTAMQPEPRFVTLTLVLSTTDSTSVVDCKRSKFLIYVYRPQVPQEEQAGRWITK